MADSNIPVTGGSGYNVDTRTNASGDHRQVIILGDPSVTDNVVNVVTADPGASSTTPGVVMRLAGSASVQLVGVSTSIGVYFDRGNPTVTANAGTGTFNVQLDPGHTLGSISGVNSSIAVYFDRANPSVNIGSPTLTGITNSLAVYFDRGNPSVNIGSQTSTLNVQLDPGHTLGSIASVGSITSSVAVYFDRSNPSVNVGSPTVTGITNSVAIYFDRGNPSVNPSVAYNSGVVGSTTQRVVHATDVATSINISAQSLAALNVGATASIFTASGTASTAGNNTLISPSASYNFKVFAYAIQTTGIVSMAPRFTTGASAGATELWRPLITPASSTSVSIGANFGVQPPGYLFATGANTTLSLYLDTASLVHYSVSYIKESA